VQIANSEFRNYVTTEKMKKKRRKNMLEKYSFYLKLIISLQQF